MTHSRRTFLKTTAGAGLALALPASRARGANEAIRLGIIGVGSTVKVGGKGLHDAGEFARIPGVRIAAMCDCDSDNLARGINTFARQGRTVRAYRDFRRMLDDPTIDAVCITTPNHWHSLLAILACQAGKDVFVQKPSSHNIFEGRRMVQAMRKYRRIVQATHFPRNKGSYEAAFEYARAGKLGKILRIRGINYRPRMSIGKVAGPQPIPPACDYDLWCGPSPRKPLMRKNLHYDWHWDWDTGNGDLGNMGIHFMDGCRWALGRNDLPRRVISVGGRLGYVDDGQTPNTLMTLLDYQPVPILFEVRGLPKNADLRRGNWSRNPSETMDRYRDERLGIIVECEDGYLRNDAAYDRDGRLITKFDRPRTSTKQNFIDCMRSRKADRLHTDALQGHLSCALVHMANISYRIGRTAPTRQIRQTVKSDKGLAETFDRMAGHLAANRIDLDKTPLTLGAALTFDPTAERFTGPMADAANRLVRPPYRKPFVVPEQV